MADPTEQAEPTERAEPIKRAEPEPPSGGDLPAPISWRSWPAREGLVRTAAVVLGLLAAAAVVYWATGGTVLAVLAAAALAVALWRFFLPVEFELSEEGVGQRIFRFERLIPWQAVDGYEACAAGVLLFSQNAGSPLASLRGLYVPWTSHREEVLAHVRHHLD